jgi:hypothetical protein
VSAISQTQCLAMAASAFVLVPKLAFFLEKFKKMNKIICVWKTSSKDISKVVWCKLVLIIVGNIA